MRSRFGDQAALLHGLEEKRLSSDAVDAIREALGSDGDEGVLKGDLTIHGVTKPVKLNVEYNGMVKDHKGNTKVGFTIDGKVNRKDFGLNWNKVLEAGGVVVGDRVKIQIELEATVK